MIVFLQKSRGFSVKEILKMLKDINLIAQHLIHLLSLIKSNLLLVLLSFYVSIICTTRVLLLDRCHISIAFNLVYIAQVYMIYLDISMVFQLFDFGFKNVYDAGSAARPLSHFSGFILVWISFEYQLLRQQLDLLLLKQLLLLLLLLLLVMLLKLNTLSCCRYHC